MSFLSGLGTFISLGIIVYLIYICFLACTFAYGLYTLIKADARMLGVFVAAETVSISFIIGLLYLGYNLLKLQITN